MTARLSLKAGEARGHRPRLQLLRQTWSYRHEHQANSPFSLQCSCIGRDRQCAQAPADPNLVYVTVEVFKPGDVPVKGLQKENFNLLEDRIAQTIAFFQEDNQTNTYRIGYLPRNAGRDGSWRAIQVKLSDPAGTVGRVTVRSKAGYYAR